LSFSNLRRIASQRRALQGPKVGRKWLSRESEATPKIHVDPESVNRLKHIEKEIAVCLRQYLQQLSAPQSPEAGINALAKAGDRLGCLLDWFSSYCGTPSTCCDGLETYRVSARKQYRLDICGFMIWDVVRQYVEVFEASVRVAKDRDELEDYVLKFGRWGFESRRIGYGANRTPLRKELDERGTWEWAFVFKKKDLRA
jgi:hypothetical protein